MRGGGAGGGVSGSCTAVDTFARCCCRDVCGNPEAASLLPCLGPFALGSRAVMGGAGRPSAQCLSGPFGPLPRLPGLGARRARDHKALTVVPLGA